MASGAATDSGPPAKGGLGTSLVKALAHQLDAQVETVSSPTGMSVSVTHATFVSRTARLDHRRTELNRC